MSHIPERDEPMGLRILIVSHSHPLVQHGGSEVASHALFEQLRADDGTDAWYLGCTRSTAFARAGQSITQPFGPDDYLYSVGELDDFRFANRDAGFARDFRSLLEALRPQVVHFHHYTNVGMEAFAHVREVLPGARIILTLHEFLAICHHQGQMVTRPERTLCRRASHIACNRCFPEISAADFFVRTLYARRFLQHVDHFVAPSRFLAQRYIDWGLPESSLSVIENVPKRGTAMSPARRSRDRPRLRVGLFGQISVLKGIEVLFDAARILAREERFDIAISIHGDHTSQPAAFQTRFLEQVEACGSIVTFHGAYLNEAVEGLMNDVDAVVVPSIWWENSPVVIQEAFRCGRPVVCSGIGGMAEKVAHGETGLHFQVGSGRALADALKRLVAEQDLLPALERGVDARVPEDPLAAHRRLYRGLRRDVAPLPRPPSTAMPDRSLPVTGPDAPVAAPEPEHASGQIAIPTTTTSAARRLAGWFRVP